MQDGDLEAVVGVWERARWAAQPGLEARMAHTHADNLRALREAIQQGSVVWLAVEEGTGIVLGLLSVKPGWIEQLHVEPTAWGRGVGSALVGLARSLYPRGLQLYTHQRNVRARRFYEGRGFSVVAVGVSPPPEREPDVLYAWRPGA